MSLFCYLWGGRGGGGGDQTECVMGDSKIVSSYWPH